jgi:two-component system phosphate regulon sensor histidine kinase PhoR
MTRNTIRFVIILAAISILGIISTQVFWVRRAFAINEDRFNQTVSIALSSVAQRLLQYNNQTIPILNPVNQLTDNYFVVKVNDVIDANLLEFFLKDEFAKRHVQTEFEYSIYDCSSDKMVYGKFVAFDSTFTEKKSDVVLPKWDKAAYYFGVYFPSKNNTIIGEMQIWIFSTFVLAFVSVFFSYTLFVILQQKRLSEIQKDFINNMTHEFKTPIATIGISAQTLRNPKIIENPERLNKYIDIILEETNRLKKQVESVLQIAIVSNNEIKIRTEEIDIQGIIEKAVQNVRPILDTHKGSISYDFLATKSMVEVDTLHLTNIIYNLLDNALKYCNKTPQIYIRTFNNANGIVIEIEDNGIGISKKNQKHIFEKFYRVPTGNLHDVKGFGLGLNYVWLMLKAHKGKITVQSEPSKGSKFCIWLPQKS